ncbi:MAG: DnaJ domain-containing protein [Verrucomicrobiota bacterium]
MTDYFALLNQPRVPWLDPVELKKIFHEKTLRAHPDTAAQSGHAGQDDAAFVQLNEAYQLLREPKRRLQHLLQLEGEPVAIAGLAIPGEIDRLFPMVATLMQETEGVMRRTGTATNALNRSLVRPEVLKAIERITQMLETLDHLHDRSISALRKLSESWKTGDIDHRSELHALYLQFSYLTKWRSELAEKHLVLTGVS